MHKDYSDKRQCEICAMEKKRLNAKCENIDLTSIATLPTEVGDGLEEQDTYSP